MVGIMNSPAVFRFDAMASPCELRLDESDRDFIAPLSELVEGEARRIEAKYSRYRPDSVISRINASAGAPFMVDEETANLLDYAEQCFKLSGGLFDITSGVLRRLWRFDGHAAFPSDEAIEEMRPLVGWTRVSWRRPVLTLQKGMEIDFGGLGKEYAVDRAILAVSSRFDGPALVNFGGDLHVTGPRRNGQPWGVTIEDVDSDDREMARIALSSGAITTSGDSRRVIIREGIRYSHILNPLTGRPVEFPPRSVTISAPTCLQAGILSTLAMLHGADAELFLQEQGVRAWCVR